jgi:PAS domain S-box-containing protein
MKDEDRTKDELIEELRQLRRQVALLQQLENRLHKADEALEETKERLELAVDGARLGLWDYNLQTGEAFFSRRRMEMLGYTLEEVEPHISWWGRLVHPDDIPKVLAAVNPHLEGQTPFYECEHRLRCKSGEYKWILARGKVVERDNNGTPLRITGISLDITARKRAEEALREAHAETEQRVRERTAELAQANASLKAEMRERKEAEEALRNSERTMRTLIDESPLGISIIRNGIRVYANPGLAKIYGFETQNEIIGLPVTNFIDAGYRELLIQAEKDILMGKPIRSFYEMRGLRKNGERFDMTFWPRRIDYLGEPAFLSFVVDTSESTRLKAQLLQAQKMEAIGTLAGGIAHDFNNILMAIIGYTQLAHSRAPEGSSVRRYLEQVLTAGSRARDLVTQILTFSRQAEQELKPVKVAPIVKEGLRLLRSSLPSTIEIREDIAVPPEGGVVLADPTQIHQVLINLCTNARDAMAAKGGILSVRLSEVQADAHVVSRYPDLKPGPYACLTVSDTGHGMDSAVIERIFDPYFSTKGPGKGTGLGLAVVRGVVDSLGGAITVYSELGHGTTFHVFLPQIGDQITGEIQAVEDHPTGDERVLFVDDEQTLVDLAKEMLESLGYRVITKTSALEALGAFRSQPHAFDLVITDMTMPGLTGKELSKELMAIRPDIPVILCTGFSELIDVRQAKETGIRELVMKPYVTGSLARTIRKVLAEK